MLKLVKDEAIKNKRTKELLDIEWNCLEALYEDTSRRTKIV